MKIASPRGRRSAGAPASPLLASAPPPSMFTTFFLSLAFALAQITGGEICDDCNLDVDDGCKCVCYSGGYDPDDPACQF